MNDKKHIINPNNEILGTEEDKLAFILFINSLSMLLRLNEGIVVDYNEKRYVVYKSVNPETNEEIMGIDVEPSFVEPDDEIYHGRLVWVGVQDENQVPLDIDKKNLH